VSEAATPPFRSEHDAPIASFGPERLELYERGTAQRGPRELLVMALERHGPSAPGRALDLGCGLGQETELLLSRGWQVTATDASARMLEITRGRARRIDAEARLRLVHAPFERTELPTESFDLANAGFSLPFAQAVHFAAIWQRIMCSLRRGGLFVGQLFGPDDEFVRQSPVGSMNAHGAADVPQLFEGLDILHHEEVNRPGETAKGSPKHWHVHHLIARRRPCAS